MVWLKFWVSLSNLYFLSLKLYVGEGSEAQDKEGISKKERGSSIIIGEGLSGLSTGATHGDKRLVEASSGPEAVSQVGYTWRPL